MDAQMDVHDPLHASSNVRDAEETSTALSESLDRLSINAAHASTLHPLSSELASSSSNSHSPTQRNITAPLSPSGNMRPSAASSRRSSSTYVPKSVPSSPKLSRRASGLSQSSDVQSKPSPRRSSSQNFSYNAIYQEEQVPLTAASVASDYFTKELDLHARRECDPTDTVVIVHNSCYGHRYSRPKTSKTNLSLIVERPERIKAGMLGISSAYIRLGDRHATGKSPPNPNRPPDKALPFMIQKSTRLARLDLPAVTNVHGTKWMQELTTMCNAAESKLASGAKELGRPETPGNSAAKPKLHEGDLYLCKDSLEAFQGALGGVLDGVDYVFTHSSPTTQSTARHKKAFVCVRPPGHHCSADMPSGFCWLNNVHVGIEYAAQTYGLTHAAIIDFDLHHGDGSQSITWDRNVKASRMPKNTPMWKKAAIGYFSLHDINSYPCEDGDREKVHNASLCIENAHGQSIWNVHLQPWKTEAEFWSLYQSRYLVLLDKARSFLRAQTQRIQNSSSSVKPKAAIFVSAGFDASEWEGAGMQRHKVNVPTEFYARFTSDISKLAKEDATSVDGRVISVLEGGYSDRALMSGVLSHLTGLVGSTEASSNTSPGETIVSRQQQDEHLDEFESCRHWWSQASLEELEGSLHPAAVPPPSRKIRSTDLATYATPTQSFTAKVVDPSKVYRSLSGVGPTIERTRSPTPPPPDVDWTIAAYELSKLLIPTDRHVDSCRPEELSEPRIKRERYSSTGLPPTEAPQNQTQVVQTRGRKSKTPVYPEPTTTNDFALPMRPAPNNRRRTLSDLPSVPDEESDPTANILDQNIERPTTSDSKAHSDGSVSQSGLPISVSTSAAENVKLGRTRRQSGILATNKMATDSAPPVPTIPKEVNKKASKNKTTKTTTSEGASGLENPSSQPSDIDNLTAAVKKITLRMPKESQTSKAPANPSNRVLKVPGKQPEPRGQKSTVPKPTTRTTKAPRSTATAAAAQQVSSAVGGKPSSPAEQAFSMKATGDDIPVPPDLSAMSGLTSESLQTAQLHGKAPVSSLPSTAIIPEPQSQPPLLNALSDSIETSDAGAKLFGQGNINASDTILTTSCDNIASEPPITSALGNLAKPHFDNEFIPYNPWAHGDGNDSTFVKPESLTWLPPNTNTPVHSPAVKRGKENLPVFTKDGHIPFAPISKDGFTDDTHTNEADPSGTKKEPPSRASEYEPSIWDVPVTPSRQ